MTISESQAHDAPSPPQADGSVGLAVLRAWLRSRTPLSALATMQQALGEIFQITLPGFRPIVVAGPTLNRSLLVTERDRFLWRNDSDPVARLLRHGVLVVDGDEHTELRAAMMPLLRRRAVVGYAPTMLQAIDSVLADWEDGSTLDMLVEMRRAALLILMKALFAVDMTSDIERLWQTVLSVIQYISPGAWIVWPAVPRPGFRRPLEMMDAYLYEIIRERRAQPASAENLLDHLIQHTDWSDDLIRDQMLTMLIAGHDTSTALLAWTLYLLGAHPDALARVRDEVDTVIGDAEPAPELTHQLTYLEMVLKETLRLYPPIHMGNRQAQANLDFGGYHIPRSNRVMLSIYASHRDPAHWDEPDAFRPERFDPHQRGEGPPPFTYIPFGGGPRNCIGAAFGQEESRIVLARIVQQFDVTLVNHDVHPHMGATLEPRPGVMMRVSRRQ